jgi:hypothetical protein
VDELLVVHAVHQRIAPENVKHQFPISNLAELDISCETHGGVGVNPISAKLAGWVYGDHIIRLSAWRDSAKQENGKYATQKDPSREFVILPFCDALRAVIPSSRVEEHAMMMKGGRLIKRIGDVYNQWVDAIDVNWRWPSFKQIIT